MFISVDTIAFVKDCNLPPTHILKKMGAKRKWTIFGRKWILNGLKGTNEPRITFYPTFFRSYRIRVDVELSKLFYGYNVRLLINDEINDALHLISKNVEDRTGIPFDAFNIPLCRIDYAVNLRYEPLVVRKFLYRYFQFDVKRLLRHTVGNTTVYFENKSRIISIYDKYIQMLKKQNVPPEVIELAKGLIRLEYRIVDDTSLERFAERLGFKDTLAKTLLSQEAIRTATDEMCKLLQVESFDYSDDSPINIAYQKTGNIKKAIKQVGFRSAIAEFGEDFYLLDGMDMCESTYKNLMKDCQKSGL
jgi:hypothetical protein